MVVEGENSPGRRKMYKTRQGQKNSGMIRGWRKEYSRHSRP